jgi:zinc finger protein
MDIMEGEKCPICSENTLTLTEMERDIPFFGRVSIFSMDCTNCNYHKADIEALEKSDPAKYTLEVESEEDLKIRIVKSSMAKVKIGTIGTIEPGEAANGYVTNVEGIINRMKHQVEHLKESVDNPADAKKAKNAIKKLTKVLWGQEKLKLVIEDPTGNSAIISEKAVKVALKVPKKKK